MPIRLKSLELQGYKTFASRTVFEFGGDITAIVGPNGSGKSNIADALRWVLGEQSSRLMRASKTEDMIFAGSQQRPRAGMASATILFDNSDGWLPIDFAEVAITRRAYRDGRNEYLLNGQPVRLRDLRDLLAQAGLGKSTYTILGQGMVDASLALKPEDRRALFEEAAGIGLYRSRRAEAIRRLETTHRNLDRLLDIMAELKPRLRYLEKQARKAMEHATLQADLRILLRDWYGYHWHRAQSELRQTRHTLQEQEDRLAEIRREYQAAQKELAGLENALAELREQLSEWRRERSRVWREKDNLQRQIAVLRERRSALTTRQGELEAELQRLTESLKTAEERIVEAESENRRLAEEASEAQAELQQARDALAARRAERERTERHLNEVRRQLEQVTRRQAETRARLESAQSQQESLENRRAALQERRSALDKRLQQAARRLEAAENALQTAEETVAEAALALEKAQAQAREQENRRKTLQETLAARRAEMASLQARLDVLQQAEQSLSGYAEGARHLLQAAREGRLKNVQGALSAALEVPAELETAITAALGEFIDAILLETPDELENALALLNEPETGRAALLPLLHLRHHPDWQLPDGQGVLGRASELVRCPDELRPAVETLLGGVLVIRDHAAARQLAGNLPFGTRLVTLQGEIFTAEGGVLAGRATTGGALSRARQRRELTATLSDLQDAIADLENDLDHHETVLNRAYQQLTEAERRLQQAREARDKARNDQRQAELENENGRREAASLAKEEAALEADLQRLRQNRQADAAALAELEAEIEQSMAAIRQAELALVELPLDEYQAQVSYWEKRLAVIENARREAERRLQERQADREQTARRRDALQAQIAANARKLVELESETAALETQLAEVDARLEALQAQIHPAEKRENQSEAARRTLQQQIEAIQQRLSRAERTTSQVQLELTRRQDALETLRGRIEEDFGLVMLRYEPEISGPVPLPLGDLVEDLPKLTELPPNLEKELKEKRAMLRRLGAVNMEAQEEYKKESERLAFLESQIADLNKAEADLRQVIAELDEVTRREFMKTYEAVSKRFSEIFQRLFGGGSARLILTDPENLTETGVEIEASLPGRRRQELSLLSGGERSLTAIALVFALLKVSPTPLCVMDEVDAMLDEANVGRFRALLEELSQETQFIIITHNRNTVQAADVIYGVTMGRDSASQIVSLRLDEVSDEMLKRE